MSKKILIATGGTGGHVFPAMALAQQLREEVPNCQVLFVGGGLANNRFFDQKGFAHHTISCGSLVDKSPWAVLKSLSQIGKGVWQSGAIIRKFKPDVAIGFGSFYSLPPLLAAKLMSVPLILHEANSIPGKVNRLLSSYAAVSGVHFPQTLSLLKGKTVEVGMPLRNGYKHSGTSTETARKHFGFTQNLPVLMTFGGSQGAKAINKLIFDAVTKVNKSHPLQLLHITGDPSVTEELLNVYRSHGINASVKVFEERMDLAWQAADVVVSRSGAGTIAEQMEFEVPGVLIPFPRAADNHQEHNANFMAHTVGGAIKVLESTLNSDVLASHLVSLLQSEANLQLQMRQAISSYKLSSRKQDLCSLVKDVLNR